MMADNVNEIIPGLYLGDKRAATDLDLLSKLELSHILSVDLVPLPQVVTSAFPNMAILQVNVADMVNEDLLSHFEKSNKFIKEGIHHGNVLVHCYHGVSRSTTLVLAYLMKSKKWSLARALDEVKAKRPIICPNEGFINQLELYEAMSCKLDKSFLPYKLYKLSSIHDQVVKTKMLPPQVKTNLHSTTMSMDNNTTAQSSASSAGWQQQQQPSLTSILTSSASSSPSPSSNSETSSGSGEQTSKHSSTKVMKRATIYKCKRCRLPLASSENVLPHWPSEVTTWPQMLKKMMVCESTEESRMIVKAHFDVNCKNGIFLEPLQWMSPCQSVSENKLHCAKCGSKLGSFAWDTPIKCACGASMAPGFHINLSRVDKCTMHKEIEAVI